MADGGKADGLDARNAILSDLSEQSVGKQRESVAQSQRQKAIEILTDMFRIDKDISAAAEAKEEKGAERDKDVALQAGEPKQPAAAVNLKEMKQVERLGKK